MVRLRATLRASTAFTRTGPHLEESTMRKPTAPSHPARDSSCNPSRLSVEGRGPPRSAGSETALDDHSHRTSIRPQDAPLPPAALCVVPCSPIRKKSRIFRTSPQPKPSCAPKPEPTSQISPKQRCTTLLTPASGASFCSPRSAQPCCRVSAPDPFPRAAAHPLLPLPRRAAANLRHRRLHRPLTPARTPPPPASAPARTAPPTPTAPPGPPTAPPGTAS